MIQIKFTPFILFLILLIVLVISIVLGNRFMDRHFNKEGFIAFAQNKNPIEEVSIPQYSSTKLVNKLDDNLFFDLTNGNLNNVYVTERDGRDTIIYNANNSNLFNFDSSYNPKQTNSVVKQDTPSSQINSVGSSYSTWLYNSNCLNTTKTNTFYSSWDTSTFISVFTNNGKQWNFTNNFYFTNNSANVNSNISDPLFITSFLPDTDTKNNTMVIDPLYDNSRQIYQLSKNVKYDIQNGNLIIISNGAAKIYDRNKNIVTNSGEISVPNVSFNPWNIIDEDGQNYILYIQNGTNTLIELVSFLDNTQSKLTLRNIKHFTPNGSINETGTVTPVVPAVTTPVPSPAVTTPVPSPPAVTTPVPSTPVPSPPAPAVPAPAVANDLSYNKMDSVISEYFKWYWYWKSSASASDDNSDYILKTQIVPPVCPSCPMCTGDSCSNSVCTNCGGNGGSGILDKSGISLFDSSGNPTSCNKLGPYGIAYDTSKNRVICGVYSNKNDSEPETNTKKFLLFDSSGNPTTCDTLGPNGIAYDNCGNITICKDVNSLSGLLNNTVDTLGGVTNNVIGGVETVAGDVVSTTGDVVSTTGDVLKTVSKDFTGLLKNNPNQLQPSYGGNMIQPSYGGNMNQPYYGRNMNQPYYGGNMNQPYYGGNMNQPSYGGNMNQPSYGGNMNQPSYGTQNQTVDQYSYYGQLPSKGNADFLPITSDFSAFGR
jgi:hypothetical protein